MTRAVDNVSLTVLLDAVVTSAEIRRATMTKFDINVGGYGLRLVIGARQLDMHLEDKCNTSAFTRAGYVNELRFSFRFSFFSSHFPPPPLPPPRVFVSTFVHSVISGYDNTHAEMHCVKILSPRFLRFGVKGVILQGKRIPTRDQ